MNSNDNLANVEDQEKLADSAHTIWGIFSTTNLVDFFRYTNFLSNSPNQTKFFAVCLPGPRWTFMPFLFPSLHFFKKVINLCTYT
jgi:hypothetical protein